jgi:hypothetical protein
VCAGSMGKTKTWGAERAQLLCVYECDSCVYVSSVVGGDSGCFFSFKINEEAV